MSRGEASNAWLPVVRLCRWNALAATLVFAGCCFEQPEFAPPLSDLRVEHSAAIPVAVLDLPADHRIGPDDIIEVEYTAAALEESGWSLMLVISRREDIEGRVLQRRIEQNTPILVTDLYLEGTEPGAPTEPDVEDAPWPPRADVALLSDELSSVRTADARRATTLFLPVAAGDLPKNRRIRPSDMSFVLMTAEEVRDRVMPEFEVLMQPEQFVGRRLRKAVGLQSPFLLSDFELDGEIKAYLDEKLK